MIYIDNEYRCHTTNIDGKYRQIETDVFDKSSAIFIEGYRFIPEGESWTREDGVVFHGKMAMPWKDYSELNAAQQEYERQLLAEYKAELAELDAALLEAQYNILIGGL